MSKKLVYMNGAQLEGGVTATYTVRGGPHNGHIVTFYTERHDCGVHGTTIECSCGTVWQSAMHGCWHQKHQRAEAGSPELAEMNTTAYVG